MQKHKATLAPLIGRTSITGFEFADGTILTTRELLARGFDLDGTERMRWDVRVAANDASCVAQLEWRVVA